MISRNEKAFGGGEEEGGAQCEGEFMKASWGGEGKRGDVGQKEGPGLGERIDLFSDLFSRRIKDRESEKLTGYMEFLWVGLGEEGRGLGW